MSKSDLIKRLQKSLGKAKNFSPNQHVKNIVSRNYTTDALLFIQRFDISNSDDDAMSHRSFRAKAIVDLGMSIECSLKSIVVSASPISESASDSYNKCRGLSHGLDKLFTECQSRCKSKVQFPKKKPSAFSDLENLGVGSRYSHDIWTLRMNSPNIDRFVGTDLVSKTIDNDVWAKELRKECMVFYNISQQSIKRFVSPHGPITGGEFELADTQIKTFFEEIKKKKNSKNLPTPKNDSLVKGTELGNKIQGTKE